MNNENSAYNEALQSIVEDYQNEVNTEKLKYFLDELFSGYLESAEIDKESLADIYYYMKLLIKFKSQLDEIEEYKAV